MVNILPLDIAEWWAVALLSEPTYIVCHVLDYQCAVLAQMESCLAILMKYTGLYTYGEFN